MTDRLAIWIAAILVVAIGADVAMFGSEHLVFLGRKFFILLEWLAFWR